MSTSSSSPRREGGRPNREGGSRAGLALLVLAVASVLLGCLALVAAWIRRLGLARRTR